MMNETDWIEHQFETEKELIEYIENLRHGHRPTHIILKNVKKELIFEIRDNMLWAVRVMYFREDGTIYGERYMVKLFKRWLERKDGSSIRK